MGEKSSMNWTDRDSVSLRIAGVMLLLVIAYLYLREYRPEYKGYQTQFHALIAQRFGAVQAKAVPHGIQQIWVKDLNRVDRCVTCHAGAEWQGLDNAPEPFRSHPREILKQHPISQYGCTVCHGGQGYAVTRADAHATLTD